MDTVLILGDPAEDHAAHMCRHIRKRGLQAHCVNSAWFPGLMTVAYDPLSETGELCLPDGVVISFDDIRSVYWRNYNGVVGPDLPHEMQSYIAENDARSLFESILIRLPARWVNSWAAFQSHQTKPAQLAAVAQLGVPTPQTLLTNDPLAVEQFAEHCSPLIFKPVQGGAHTRRITVDDLTDERLALLRLAPVTLQEEIEGTNIRVFVIGGEVLACEVKTSEVDFRDDQEPKITPHLLPEKVQTECRSIAETLGLLWTGIDFRLRDDGQYVFLEANPSPMFIGFEEGSGLPLTDRLGDLLTAESIPDLQPTS